MQKSGKRMLKNQKMATLMVLLGASLWGAMGLFVRYFNRLGLGAMDILFLRILVAVTLLTPLVALLRPKALRIHLRDFWCFFGTGILSMALFSYCYFETIARTSLSVAAVLLYGAPVIVVLLSAWFFKEKLTLQKGIACGMAVLGCVLVSNLKGGTVPPAALLTGVLSAVGYAFYSIFSRFAINRGYHSFTIVLYTFFLAALPVSLLAEIPATFAALGRADRAAVWMVLLMGLVTVILPYIFYTLGLSGLPAGKASVMATVEPVVATLLGMLFVNEPLTFLGMTGILLVLSGVALLHLRVGKKAKI